MEKFNPKQILLEDNHLIVVNKLAGQLSQGDRTQDLSLADELKQYIRTKYDKPGDVFLGVVHRIDRPTSGAIVYARTSKALVRLNEMLRERKLEKTYWAVTRKAPIELEGTLKHYLQKQGSNNTSKLVSPKHKLGKEAILHYKIIKSTGDLHLWEIKLETGRHHQIRVQLSAVGCPIVGDKKYRYRDANEDGSICLHARELSFIHPVQKVPVKIVAPTPDFKVWRQLA